MKRIATAVTAATTLLGGLALTAATAPTTAATSAPVHRAPTEQTLTFTARQLASKQLGSNYLVETDKVIRKGHVVGYTANHCTFDFTTSTAVCDVTVALNKGTIRAHVHVQADDNTVEGTITGGTGPYRGATGSVTGKPGARPGDERITLDYTA